MSRVAIFCEGSTDIVFLKEFIEYLGFRKNDVEPYIMKGKSHFFEENHKYYDDAKRLMENNGIQKILFVMDADDVEGDKRYGSYENTEKELSNLIARLGLQNVSEAYIMCNPKTKTGYLESLILSTIDEQIRHCIECFLACSQFESKESHKAILNKIYNMAYPNAPYDFQHENFKELKEILTSLFK